MHTLAARGWGCLLLQQGRTTRACPQSRRWRQTARRRHTRRAQQAPRAVAGRGGRTSCAAWSVRAPCLGSGWRWRACPRTHQLPAQSLRQLRAVGIQLRVWVQKVASVVSREEVTVARLKEAVTVLLPKRHLPVPDWCNPCSACWRRSICTATLQAKAAKQRRRHRVPASPQCYLHLRKRWQRRQKTTVHAEARCNRRRSPEPPSSTQLERSMTRRNRPYVTMPRGDGRGHSQ